MTQFQRFRVVIKRGEHPTTSLTLRCFDIVGTSREEVEQLCGTRGRSGGKLQVVARPCDAPMSEAVYANLLARRERRIAGVP